MSYVHKRRSKSKRSQKSRTVRRLRSNRIRKKVKKYSGKCAKTSLCACPDVRCMVKTKCRGKTKCPWSKSRIAKYT